jgi:hypothetical protein
LNSFDRPQLPEKVLKIFVLRPLKAIIHLGNVGPDLGGGSGDGDQDRGRALWEENRPQFILVPTSAILIFLN